MTILRLVGLLFLLIPVPTFLQAADRILVLPSLAGDPAVVVRPGDLVLEQELPVPTGAFRVLQDGAGDVYFVLSNRASEAVTVLDAATLEIQETIALSTGVSDGVVTPDGKYLLLTSGDLVVVDLETYQVVATVSIGGSAKSVIVSDDATTAYAIAGIRSQRKISAVDLKTLSVTAQSPQLDGLSDLVLIEAGSLVLAVAESAAALYEKSSLEEVEVFKFDADISEAEIDLIPGGPHALLHGTGRQTNNASLTFNWESGETDVIGPSTDNLFDRVAVLNSTTTYAILSSDNSVVSLNTTDPLNTEIEPIDPPLAAVDLGLSPNHKELFVFAANQNRVLKFDTVSLQQLDALQIEPKPRSGEMLFIPGDLPPVSLVSQGGDHQFGIPNNELELPFTVRLSNDLEQPVADAEVLFEDISGLGFEFKPSARVKTNAQGLAVVRVKLPPRSNFGPQAEDVQSVALSATAPGVRPAFFDVQVVHATGLTALSGNFQLVTGSEDLPKPLVLSATDAAGKPLKKGTELTPIRVYAGCTGSAAVNAWGFVSMNCRTAALPQFLISRTSIIVFRALDYQEELGQEGSRAQFEATAFHGALGTEIENLAGDGQSAETDVPLLAPLEYKVASRSSTIIPVHVEASRVTGPPVDLSPTFEQILPGASEQVVVTTGPYAGTAVVQVEASVSDLPTATYTIEIVPETPSFLTKKNDGQSAKIHSQLAKPLEIAVLGKSGKLIPFPLVEWEVISGSASISALSTSTGSSATVNLGALAGDVVIHASVGALTSVFRINSLGPEPDEITLLSGQGQSLTPGTLSDPISVLLLEDDVPAAGSIVEFSGPPTLVFHPVGAGAPGNPLITNADLKGHAAARVELVPVTGLSEQGAAQQQTAGAMVMATVSSGTVSRDVTFGVIGRKPEFTTNSLVNAASFRPGIVPGGLASIFGAGLVETITKIVLPSGVTSFNGTTIRVDGIPAPLLAFIPGTMEQINFQVPFDIAPGQLVSVEVENNGTKTTVENVAIFSVQPGIFEVPQGQGKIGAVLHANGSLVTAANPADLGEALSLYFTGGGSLNDPGAATGELGPAEPPLTTVGQTEVLVGGVKADVLFSGYAPSFMGLYQTNFRVPPDIICGQQSLAVVVSATPSPASMINIKCP